MGATRETGEAATRALTRRRNVLLAQHHRDQGWSIAQIAHLLDRAPATVRGYLHDPNGEKAKHRKTSYAGTCERCGTPTSGADGKHRASRHCQRCKPQSRPRWTRELVRGAHRFWLERFGFVASSVDWSGTHARRRGGNALERYRSARWPSQSVIRRLYGTSAAARADAFPAARENARGGDRPAGADDPQAFAPGAADATGRARAQRRKLADGINPHTQRDANRRDAAATRGVWIATAGENFSRAALEGAGRRPVTASPGPPHESSRLSVHPPRSVLLVTFSLVAFPAALCPVASARGLQQTAPPRPAVAALASPLASPATQVVRSPGPRARAASTTGACAGVEVAAVAIPAVSAPAITVPDQTLAGYTVPGFTIPALEIPAQVVPAQCVIYGDVPAGCLGAVTIPGVTIPGIQLPAVTIPAVDVPGAYVAGATIAGNTVPAASVPSAHTPTECPRRDRDGFASDVQQLWTYRGFTERGFAQRLFAFRAPVCVDGECIPSVTIPGVSAPSVSAPGITVPSRTLARTRLRELASSCAHALRGEGQLAVDLCGDPLFAPGSSRLRAGADTTLRRLARALRRHSPTGPIRVEGHTDSAGDADANVRLSLRRAKAVGRWLIAHRVAPERIAARGWGEDWPTAPNRARWGRTANRRVVIAITVP